MLKIKTSEDASYRGATIAKVKRAMDSAMKKAGFSFVRENGFGERRFQKNGREVAYVLQGQSGDPSHIDRIVVTKFNPMERSGFDAFGQEGSAVEKAVAWFDGASESLNKGNAMKAENHDTNNHYFHSDPQVENSEAYEDLTVTLNGKGLDDTETFEDGSSYVECHTWLPDDTEVVITLGVCEDGTGKHASYLIEVGKLVGPGAINEWDKAYTADELPDMWVDFEDDLEKVISEHSANESKKSEGLPPKRLGSKRQYRSRADLINKMKQLGAVEITTSKQFNDIKNSQWLHTAGYALDTNGNLVAQSYYGDKDGKWYYTSTRNFDGDYLPESKQHEGVTDDAEKVFNAVAEECGVADRVEVSSNNGKVYFTLLLNLNDLDKYVFEYDTDTHYLRCLQQATGDTSTGSRKKFDDLEDVAAWLKSNVNALLELEKEAVELDGSTESKKSESLSLKQKELKDMVRYGEAEDITTISDAEAKELRKKGIELVGVSRGVYGMNGALLRDNEGKKYVITARSSNLFYFV